MELRKQSIFSLVQHIKEMKHKINFEIVTILCRSEYFGERLLRDEIKI